MNAIFIPFATLHLNLLRQRNRRLAFWISVHFKEDQMNSVNSIFLAVAVIFGGGYALDKIYVSVKTGAVELIHQGMPHLSEFTNRLTCSDIAVADGKLRPI